MGFASASRPALAHNCTEPVTIVQGELATVQVHVNVGDEGANEVNLEFDDGFTIRSGVSLAGWDVAQEQTAIRFSGGDLEPGACAQFDVPVKAKDSGVFRVRAFQRLKDGQWSEHPPDGDVFMDANGVGTAVNHEGVPNPIFEQVIYVTGSASASSGTSLPLLFGTAALVGATIILLAPRRKRRRHTRGAKRKAKATPKSKAKAKST